MIMIIYGPRLDPCHCQSGSSLSSVWSIFQYQHMPSFGGIKRDCDTIMVDLKTQLKAKLSNSESSPAEMSECVGLLLQLDEPSQSLCLVFLETSGRRLGDSLAVLEKQISLASAGGHPVKNPQTVAFNFLAFFNPKAQGRNSSEVVFLQLT